MKYFITIMVLLIAAVAYAAKADLPVDGKGIRIQSFAPDGTKSAALTIAKQTVDMRDDIAWSAYTPTACKFRSMTTATFRDNALNTLPANTRTTMHVNAETPFINFTGCTSGELSRQ